VGYFLTLTPEDEFYIGKYGDQKCSKDAAVYAEMNFTFLPSRQPVLIVIEVPVNRNENV